MSQQTVESVLTRAMSDTAFADALFANPEKALTGFNLTAEEIANLKFIDVNCKPMKIILNEKQKGKLEEQH